MTEVRAGAAEHLEVRARVVINAAGVFVPDVRQDLDYIEGNPRSVAELVVPIRFRDETLGFINLESAKPAAFSPAMNRDKVVPVWVSIPVSFQVR